MKMIRKFTSLFTGYIRKKYSIRNIACGNKTVYLTFDDGPEPGITEFVLEELDKYNAKGTFFCCGNNISAHHSLYEQIVSKGHAIGSHTMTHLRGASSSCSVYCKEVEEFLNLYKTNLHRPPYESITICQLLRLKNKCRIILWDVDSKDWTGSDDVDCDVHGIVSIVKTGSIVLFHFCREHEKRTKYLLPKVLDALNNQGYKFEAINLS